MQENGRLELVRNLVMRSLCFKVREHLFFLKSDSNSETTIMEMAGLGILLYVCL